MSKAAVNESKSKKQNSQKSSSKWKPNMKRSKVDPLPSLDLAESLLRPTLLPPTKQNDPTYFDPTIVRLNSASIVGRTQVSETAELIAAANISETEVELLLKTPLKDTVSNSTPLASRRAAHKQSNSLNLSVQTKVGNKSLSTSLKTNENKHLFLGLDHSRMETAKARKL